MRSSKTLLTAIGDYCKLCSSSNGLSVDECPMFYCPLWEHREGAIPANLAAKPRYSDPNSRHKREISYIVAKKMRDKGSADWGQRTYQKASYVGNQAESGDKYAIELMKELDDKKISIHRAYTLYKQYVKDVGAVSLEATQ